MGYNRIVVLGCASAVVFAFAVAGVDRLDTGTERRQSSVKQPSPPRRPVGVAENADEPPSVDELARPGLGPKAYPRSFTLGSDMRRVTMDAVAQLAEVPGQQSDLALADAALAHGDYAIREEAMHALGERGGIIALQTLQQALEDPNARVQQAAVRALVDMGGDDAVSALGSVLSTGDASMRVSALDGLGQIGGPDATRYVEQTLRDENDVVRDAAAQWLVELRSGSI